MKSFIPALLSIAFLSNILGCCNCDNEKRILNTVHNDSLSRPKPVYKVSLGALSLINAFNSLSVVTKPPCQTGDFPSVSSVMPVKYFAAASGAIGNVTFGVFKYTNPVSYDTHIFRVIWDSLAGAFRYYGVCPPDQINFPIKDDYSNDVFEAMLIPVREYQKYRIAHLPVPAYPNASEYAELYAYAQTNTKFALDVTKIESVTKPSMEPADGFMSKFDNFRYLYNYSSIGIRVWVKTKMDIGSSKDVEIDIPCYIVNNYDCAGTLIWKE